MPLKLDHTKIKNISREPRKPTTPHTPEGCTTRPDPGSSKRNCCRHKQARKPARVRCSRPLCSSQTTTPYHTPRTNHPHKRGQPPRTANAARKPETPNPHPRTPRKGARGPRPCCLRTQQCAKHENRPSPTRTVPGHPAPQKDKTTVLGAEKETTGRYLLIFHP